MCIIIFSYLQHPRYKLILAANRDEFHTRKTQTAHFWHEYPVLAGKDLVGGGTWIGVNREGRWSALTNYRVPFAQLKPDAQSRGHLTLDFLVNNIDAEDYLQPISQQDELYNGYNLLLGTSENLTYYSNVEKQIKTLEAGFYGVSNHLLNTPWFKVEKAVNNLKIVSSQENFNPHDLLEMMHDTEKAPDSRLPNTGVPLDWEKTLSSIFIELSAHQYGTCCTTILLIDYQNKVHFIEKQYMQGYEGILQEFRF